MDENFDRLTETFAAHEYLMPDPAQVLDKANLRARSYRRRRRAARATGVSVLGAGIVAGGVTLPNLKWHRQGSSGVVTASQPLSGISLPTPVASASPSVTPAASPISSASSDPTPVPSVASYNQQQEIDAYLADGYDYNNAIALSTLWNETDLTKVKADAGLKLLQGETLPVTPNGTPEGAAEKDMDDFFAAGYDYNDAVTLGTLWHQTDIVQVKTDAGQKLLAGLTLPIAPSGSADGAATATPSPETSVDAQQAADLAAYFAAGYDYDNAVTLSGLWHQTDIGQVKADAGQKLLAGQSLPVAPAGASPTAS